ncbi:MAG: exodeoxyribonuclease III [Ezakiella sp.]|nr:exodeoxyribonuclease III [Ezakiella sp.]
MKLISWNVNGIRAILNKGFMGAFNKLDADIFALQETKCQVGQVELDLPGYYQFWHQADKKGYSGTAVFSKVEPINVRRSGIDFFDDNEGRILELEFDDFYFVNCYTPNSKRDLSRIPFRVDWEARMREYLSGLAKTKPVIYTGDLNVAHKEIDLANPDTNHKSAGFTDEERENFTFLLEAGFTDTFREKYPDKTDIYTWWSYITRARERNVGWRIDYFVVSNDIKDKIIDAAIHDDIMGSDHCPVELKIEI